VFETGSEETGDALFSVLGPDGLKQALPGGDEAGGCGDMDTVIESG